MLLNLKNLYETKLLRKTYTILLYTFFRKFSSKTKTKTQLIENFGINDKKPSIWGKSSAFLIIYLFALFEQNIQALH